MTDHRYREAPRNRLDIYRALATADDFKLLLPIAIAFSYFLSFITLGRSYYSEEVRNWVIPIILFFTFKILK